jgi:DNA-binding beta-propeller fold protein YncE
LVKAAIWYGLFTIFYTSVFTNGAGFFTGLVGSLGYWLEQQGVERGSQPLYYYALVQVPIYEYLPALGVWLAFGVVIWKALTSWLPSRAGAEQPPASEQALQLPLPEFETDPPTEEALGEQPVEKKEPAPVFASLAFFSVTSLIAFSIAGEKMPWLTVHITLPAILLTGWVLGLLIESIDWSLLRQKRGWLIVFLLPVFLLSLIAVLGSVLGAQPPFQGKELAQLQATSQFLTSFLVSLASGVGLFYLAQSWPGAQFVRLLTLFGFGLLGLLTARTSIQANFYNYDNANELLVYAHSAPGVKTALAQIEEISRRTTDGLGIAVAYDNETSYPYWWYLRNYPNAQYYGENPSRTLRDVPLILVGDANFGKMEPVVANMYDQFDYIRLWWPNQDYYDLSWERVKNALLNPAMRKALFKIWLDRDYTEYGKVTNKDMSLPNWSPAARMRLYIRKDITSKLWNYGSAPAPVEQVFDPFEGKHMELAAVQSVGSIGSQPGQLQRPRDVAVAQDGSLYVTDTDNHRIQHLSPQGEVLHIWGSFGDVAQGSAPGGTFNQPWGIALGPDGSVYVADTWNHRVQKFTSQGEFVQMWGYFGQAEQPEGFWGPRDVAVDVAGRVYVTDTGNKRVVVFNEQGEYISQFGGAGMGPGQLDEPVGVAVDLAGLVYVADTWNQRIQVFQSDDQNQYTPLRSWELQAWYGQSLDNKPYLSVDGSGFLFASDPEGYRVMQFSLTGEPIRSWGDFGVDLSKFGLPVGLSVDPEGGVWVVDTANNRLLRFIMPE